MDVWGPSIVSAIGAVLISTILAVVIASRVELERRRGVRTLLSAEIIQNHAVLLGFMQKLNTFVPNNDGQVFDDARIAIAVFRDIERSPQWDRSRWNLPDVGVALSRKKLMRLSKWYVKLDQLTLLCEQYRGHLVGLNFSSAQDISLEVAELSMAHLTTIHAFASNLMKNLPPLPDEGFDQDPEIKQYKEELRERAKSTYYQEPKWNKERT